MIYRNSAPSKLGRYENAIKVRSIGEGLFHRSVVIDIRYGGISEFSPFKQGLISKEEIYKLLLGLIPYSIPNKGYEGSIMGAGSLPTDINFQNMLGTSVSTAEAGFTEKYNNDNDVPYYDIVNSDESIHTLDYED